HFQIGDTPKHTISFYRSICYTIILGKLPDTTDSEYVFADDGKAGYLIEPRRQVQKVTEFSGVIFTLHDLRCTFITIAENIDISAYALKRLVNHKMSSDVTASYIVNHVERLRRPMEQISLKLLQLLKV
ncbi:hypothetical protein SAMN05421510_10967, partial [Nitrosomonas ureae]